MPKEFKNFNQFYRFLNLVYNFILISNIFLLTVVYALTKQHHFNFEQIDPKILYLNVLAGFIIYWLAGFIKKKLQRKASKITQIREKLKLFQQYFVINLVIVEIYGLLNSFGYLWTHNLVFMFFGAYALLLLLLMKPKPEKMSYLLLLTANEEAFIKDPFKSFQ